MARILLRWQRGLPGGPRAPEAGQRSLRAYPDLNTMRVTLYGIGHNAPHAL